MYNLLCVLLKINRQSITCLFFFLRRSIHNFPGRGRNAGTWSVRVDDSQPRRTENVETLGAWHPEKNNLPPPRAAAPPAGGADYSTSFSVGRAASEKCLNFF